MGLTPEQANRLLQNFNRFFVLSNIRKGYTTKIYPVKSLLMNKSPPENNAIDVKFNPGPYLCIFFLNGSSFLTERSEKNKKWEKKPLIHTAIHYKFNNLLRRSLCLEVFTVRWATKKQNCLTTVYQQPSNSCICEVRTQCSHFQVFLDKFSSQDYRVNTIYFIKGSSAFPWVQPREEFGGRGFGFVHLGFKNKAIFLQYIVFCACSWGQEAREALVVPQPCPGLPIITSTSCQSRSAHVIFVSSVAWCHSTCSQQHKKTRFCLI